MQNKNKTKLVVFVFWPLNYPNSCYRSVIDRLSKVPFVILAIHAHIALPLSVAANGAFTTICFHLACGMLVPVRLTFDRSRTC